MHKCFFFTVLFCVFSTLQAQNANLIDITTLDQLDAMRYDLNGDGTVDDAANAEAYGIAFGTPSCAGSCTGYELMNTLDFAGTKWGEDCVSGCLEVGGSEAGVSASVGWLPIGDNSTSSKASRFTAEFEGNNHTIFNLYINRTADYVGFFGSLGSSGEIHNLIIKGGSVTGDVSRSFASGVGGLVGRNFGGTISACYATGNATATGGSGTAGCLVGWNSGKGTISACYATGNAESTESTGGFAGGLVGWNFEGTISACYATGNAEVAGSYGYAGGLVGYNYGTISAGYATGTAEATGTNGEAGGLVGHNIGTISACYATGTTEAAGTHGAAGGLVGNNNGGTIVDSYFDYEASGREASEDYAQSTSALQFVTDYTGIYENWDITQTSGTEFYLWALGTPSEYPVLYLDFDGTNLIDITTLDQLDAVRYDLNGDGTVDDVANAEAYSTAFGTPSCAGSCAGYELINNLDFANTKWENPTGGTFGGTRVTGGWEPIGKLTLADRFNAVFEGNNYTIYNLYINRHGDVSFFGYVGPSAQIRNLKFVTDPVSDLFGITPDSSSVASDLFGITPDSSNVASDLFGIPDFSNTRDANLIDITTLDQLDAVRYDLNGDGTVDDVANAEAYGTAFGTPSCAGSCEGYELMNNLDFAGTKWGEDCVSGCLEVGGSEAGVAASVGWLPIGDNSTSSKASRFTAEFEGNNHTISNLYIDRAASYVGLFGSLDSSGTVRNLGIEGGSVTQREKRARGLFNTGAGCLVGKNFGTISACYATGNATATGNDGRTGGLVGSNNGGTIRACYATGNAEVAGSHGYAGGLVGYNYGTISACYATGTVEATGINGDAGGLVGHNYGTISACYATGTAEATGTSGIAGGLVGYNYRGTISACYATGNAEAIGLYVSAGGLVGYNYGTISACYATGNAEAGAIAGGLVGSNYRGTISACYATGNAEVAGSYGYAGGLVGHNNGGTIVDSYFDYEASGREASEDDAQSTSALQSVTDYTGIYENWDITQTSGTEFYLWALCTPSEYPVLYLDFDNDSYQNPCSSSATDSVSDLFSTIPDSSSVASDLFGITPDSSSVASDLFGITPDSSNVASDLFGIPDFSNTRDASLIDITTLDQLDAMRYDLNGDGTVDDAANAAAYSTAFGTPSCAGSCTGYELMNTLDFAGTKWGEDCVSGCLEVGGSEAGVSASVGWLPIGDNSTSSKASRFTAEFEGNNHTISNLYIDRAANYIGLFGSLGSSGTVRNLGIEGGSVAQREGVRESFTSGVGCLVGKNFGGTISACYATGNAAASGKAATVGGLVGMNSGGGTINACYATGNAASIELTSFAGGLVGYNYGKINACYATGNATAAGAYGGAGGLVGWTNSNSTISACYATGTAEATGANGVAGGLVGYNYSKIRACYATGTAEATGANGFGLAGGLVGDNYGEINACYATGTAEATGANGYAGGLVGSNENGTILDSYFDYEASGREASEDDAQSTSALQSITDYTGIYENWDITQTSGTEFYLWALCTPSEYPVLYLDFDSESYQNPCSSSIIDPVSDLSDSSNVVSDLFGIPDFSNTRGANLIDITTLDQLDAVRYDLNGDGTVDDIANAEAYSTAFGTPSCEGSCEGYELMNNLDFADTKWENPTGGTFGGTRVTGGWNPIGKHTLNVADRFNAVFEGNSYTIYSLYINRPRANDGVGFFGYVGPSAQIRNLKLVGANVSGGWDVGCLVGRNYQGSIIDGCYAEGASTGNVNVGGLIGNNLGGIVSSSSALVTAENSSTTYGTSGGLVGSNIGIVRFCYSKGKAIGGEHSGALVGYNWSTIYGCYSTGQSARGIYIGGLVGSNSGTIYACYAAGPPLSSTVVAHNAASCVAGGLVGHNSGTIRACYSTVQVTTVSGIEGGLVGHNENGTIVDSYFDYEASGREASEDDAQSTSALQSITDYTGIYENWDITQTSGTEFYLWALCTPSEYPVLYLDFDSESYQNPCSSSIIETTNADTLDVEDPNTDAPDDAPDVKDSNTDASGFAIVYPNPATYVLNVERLLHGSRTYTYAIYTEDGQLALSGILQRGWIDIASLVNGQYIVSLQDDRGKERRFPLLISR